MACPLSLIMRSMRARVRGSPSPTYAQKSPLPARPCSLGTRKNLESLNLLNSCLRLLLNLLSAFGSSYLGTNIFCAPAAISPVRSIFPGACIRTTAATSATVRRFCPPKCLPKRGLWWSGGEGERSEHFDLAMRVCKGRAMWLELSGGGGYIEPRVRKERGVKWDKGLW